jgi:hypothetical protein
VTAGSGSGACPSWKRGSSVTAQSTSCIVGLLIVSAIKADIIARKGARLPLHFDKDEIQQ